MAIIPTRFCIAGAIYYYLLFLCPSEFVYSLMTCLITGPFFSQDWEILSGKSRNLRIFVSCKKNLVTGFGILLIISDEEKHRAVIHAMVATLRGSLMWTRPEGSLEGPADLAEANGQLRVSLSKRVADTTMGLSKFFWTPLKQIRKSTSSCLNI